MTESMIERMARAAFNAHSQRGEDHWANADPIQRETKIREMTAALMAMREPTGRMLTAARHESAKDDIQLTIGEVEDVYHAMIAAALNPLPA
ncbi:MAG: hypothetical protein AB7V18_20550 [Pyrinomonadaceae bacterium]